MRAESAGRRNKLLEQGASILEVLIALTVLTLGIASATMLSFANQSLKLDSDTAGEALYKAKEALESARASSREDFNLLMSAAPAADDIYLKEVAVTDITPCKKEVVERISWSTEPGRPQKIELKTELADVAEALALGDDCGSSAPTSDWKNPATLGTAEINPFGNEGTGIDIIKINRSKYAFLSSRMSSPEKHDFWAINLETNPPSILSSLNTGSGLNAIDVARNTVTGRYYAYLANDDGVDQFQVVEVTNPASPILVASKTLPGVSGSCPYTCPGGRSIFYYKHKVYIGTHRLVGASKHEFHVYDVSNPTSPAWLGSKKIDHNINAIRVRGNKAYLATSADTKELIVLNVSATANITEIDSFDAKWVNGNPSTEDGISLYLVGNKLYLGRKRASNANERDFYILNINNLSAPFGSRRLQMSPNTEISDIVVRGGLAFLATTDLNAGFQVWSVADPADIKNHNKYNYSDQASGIEFMDNRVYVSNFNQALRVIFDNP